MRNTAIETFLDTGIVFALCVLIFVLPASIALLDSFAALAIFFYLLKKLNRLVIDWPLIKGNILVKIVKGFAPRENFLNRPLQLFSAAVFISVIFSHYPCLSLFAFFGKFLKCVFLYFSFIEAFSDEKRIRIFLKCFLLSAFLTVLYGIIEHYAGEDFFKGHSISSDRVNSFLFGANELGPYLLFPIALVAHFLFMAIVRHRSLLLRGALALFLLLLLTCLLWTYSRSSWIGFLTIIAAMWLLDKRKILFVASLLLLFIFVFLPSLSNVRHLHLIKDTSNVQNENLLDVGSLLEQGGSGRHKFWKKAVSIIRTSPVYGTGLNTYSRIIKLDPDRTEQWYAHNSYLQMTAETGLIGLLCFLWMVFVLLQRSINYCQHIKGSWLETFLQGAISGLFGLLVQSFFDNTFFTVQLIVLLWMMIGLMVAVTRLSPDLQKNI